MENDHLQETEQMEKTASETESETPEETSKSMHIAMEAAGIYYFEYYPEENYALQYSGKEDFHLNEREENYPECWFQRKITHPEDEEILRNVFYELKNGAKEKNCTIRNKLNGEYRWNYYTFTSIYNMQGVRTKIVCTAQDVTELKSGKALIEEEKKAQDGIDSDKLLLKTRANITKDIVESLEEKPELISYGFVTSFAQGVLNLVNNAYTYEDGAILLEMLSTEKITRAAEKREHYRFNYRRKDKKGYAHWIQVVVKSFVNSEDGDVIAFVYLNDVHNVKIVNTVLNKITDVDFEVLALIHTDTDEIESVRQHATENFVGIDCKLPYSIGVQEFIDAYILLEEREAASEAFRIENIKKQLETQPVYEFSFGLQNNKFYEKKWEYAYLDETKKTIIYTRADITELFQQQEEQKRALHDALIQAEEASNAKTNFLSRMSHEIRTPMNAIIGMNTLATQVADNPKEVRECLAKIGLSARFLLSLINDILDMSRIESGKITVNQKKFPLDEMVQSINTIFYEQAEKKGVDYDCIIASFVSDYYVGDAMKLQQVIVNLLGNAIKFTKPGGRVQLVIRQERVANGKAYMSFSVNDTGIGISEEFQKKMFEPFEQSDVSTTSPYKGTGLGLAIARNLVTMMDGSIQVHSIEGIGTEFIVRVPLGICKDEDRYQKLELDVALEKLKTLIVDDDIMICEHTKNLLAEMGMKAEWVESGYRALELIREKWLREEYFDVVLLDWKMPDMDGIETARRIRKIVGDEVTIIVITAYDWAEIEVQAKQAGVNLLVTKPLFKGSLISVFQSAFQRKEHEAIKMVEREYNFTGKNILVVEDHVLNVEIAKRLLEIKDANVYVAENGLRAIEMFTEAEDGFYDAILMDIRMPIMDGLTATRSIRQLRKRSAKTVPIIAMSANAFEEDVEKSREAGMNEHLSKPIEPAILYATLQKWLFQ